uniref:Thiamine-phosphate synthase n=1 Tax=candidate division WOR-3 bacterium TaxID=2052148 RepID=A0A7C4YHC2_UNCW3
MMKDVLVYLVTDSRLTLGRSVEFIVEEACKSGVSMVQFRDKEMDDMEFVRLGKRLREITKYYDIPLILNDRVHLVKEIEADGVHLGQEDLSINEARKLIGYDKIIGVSVSNIEEANNAIRDGADYIGISGIFKTDTKKDAKYIGIEGLKRIAENVGGKILKIGIGGIKPENAKDVIIAGADGVAVVTAITMAENIEEAVRRLKEAVIEGRKERKNER